MLGGTLFLWGALAHEADAVTGARQGGHGRASSWTELLMEARIGHAVEWALWAGVLAAVSIFVVLFAFFRGEVRAEKVRLRKVRDRRGFVRMVRRYQLGRGKIWQNN